MAVIDAAGVPVFLTTLPHGISGLANRVNGRWYVAADTASSSAGRLRFTLAHELGHVAMDHTPSVDDASTLRMRDSGDEQEVEANYFAAEFLLPRNAVYDRFETAAGHPASIDQHIAFVEDVARDYGTTVWVPLYRLRTLDLLSNAEVAAVGERLRMAPSSEGDHDDVAAHIAGTGRTRMPPAHEMRLEMLQRLDYEGA